MLIPKPEQFSVITYLSQYYHHFVNQVQGNPGLGLATIETGGPVFASGGAAPVPKAYQVQSFQRGGWCDSPRCCLAG